MKILSFNNSILIKCSAFVNIYLSSFMVRVGRVWLWVLFLINSWKDACHLLLEHGHQFLFGCMVQVVLMAELISQSFCGVTFKDDNSLGSISKVNIHKQHWLLTLYKHIYIYQWIISTLLMFNDLLLVVSLLIFFFMLLFMVLNLWVVFLLFMVRAFAGMWSWLFSLFSMGFLIIWTTFWSALFGAFGTLWTLWTFPAFLFNIFLMLFMFLMIFMLHYLFMLHFLFYFFFL